MPISARAAQQIADLLSRAGVPANTALDVAQRLLSDSLAGSNSKSLRTLNGDQANAFGSSSSFGQREQSLGGGGSGSQTERATKDGIVYVGGYYEKDGTDGKEGKEGQQGTAGQDGQIVDAGFLLAFLEGWKKEALSCSWVRGCIDEKKSGECTSGMFRGSSICSILEQQAKALKKLDKRVTVIEEMLKDTVDCSVD